MEMQHIAFPSILYYGMENRVIMQPDRLTGFPFELLISIIHLLDPLSILHCRQLHSRYKSCVDSLPEYQAYQTKFQDIIEQYRSTHDGRPRRWTLERAAEFFEVVRVGVEIDYYVFVEVLLSYPQAKSYVSVIRESGRRL